MRDYKYLEARFIALYVLLTLIAAGSFFGAYKGLNYVAPPKHPVTQSQLRAALGETDLVHIACRYTTAQAASQGVILTSCKKVRVEVKGNTALVTLHQTSTDGQKFTIAVTLGKGIWTVSGFKVGPG